MFQTEKGFVRWLKDHAPASGKALKLGIGDDAALVRGSPGCEWLLKTDLSVEGVHFDCTLHPPRSIGHRAIARSLSDIAAMGGTPRFALISLAIPPETRANWLNELMRGVFELAARFRVSVVGGDTSIVPGKTAIDAIVLGEVPRGRAIRRDRARPNDLLYVSGHLGYAALGLEILRSKGVAQRSSRLSLKRTRRPADVEEEAIGAHLYPEPRVALGRFLGENRLATAMIDVSDGLSSDLARLCEASGTGATLWADAIPAPYANHSSLSKGQEHSSSQAKGLDLALHGGEDYELLFTVPRRKAANVPVQARKVHLLQIGEIERRPGLRIVDSRGRESGLEPRGWDHFRRTIGR